jgi:hypothetical protein
VRQAVVRGTVLLDPTGAEEAAGAGLLSVATMPALGRVTQLVQAHAMPLQQSQQVRSLYAAAHRALSQVGGAVPGGGAVLGRSHSGCGADAQRSDRRGRSTHFRSIVADPQRFCRFVRLFRLEKKKKKSHKTRPPSSRPLHCS